MLTLIFCTQFSPQDWLLCQIYPVSSAILDIPFSQWSVCVTWYIVLSPLLRFFTLLSYLFSCLGLATCWYHWCIFCLVTLVSSRFDGLEFLYCFSIGFLLLTLSRSKFLLLGWFASYTSSLEIILKGVL